MRPIKKLLQKYREFVIPAVSGIFIILVTLKVIIPQALQSIDRYSQLNNRIAQLDKLTKKHALLTSVTENETAGYLRDAEVALPTEKDAASVLIALENLSAATQLALDTVDLTPGLVSTDAAQAKPKGSPAPEKRSEITTTQTSRGVPALLISAKMRGSTDNLKNFLTQLANMRRFFDIETAQIGYFPDTPDFLSVEFTLNAYFLPPITQLGGVEAELPEITAQEKATLVKLATMPNLSQSLAPDAATPTSDVGKPNLFNP